MPRYIDADALLEKAWDADTRIGYVQVVDVGDVIDAPTISPDEVRVVVHCRECSHADKNLPGVIHCTMLDVWKVPEYGFCCKGAKMEVSEDA